MGQITSSVGLISGINTGQIITALINADAVPVNLLQTRVTSNTNLSNAYQGLSTQLQALQATAKSFEQPSTFQAATATSSDPSVLTATAANGSSVGTYSLQVARLVTTQQLISTGFTDSTGAKVGAGTITIDEGGGGLATQTPLASLNGGTGIGRGQFRVTDRSGASSVIDTSSAVTLDDVVDKINSADNISVRASVQNNKLVLADNSGKTTSNLIVQDLGNGTSATDLGISGNIASATLTGTDINYLSRSTSLNQLNDGRGITTATTGDDFYVNLADGSRVSVNLGTAKTVGDVVDAINTAGGGKITAAIPPGATGLQLTDNTNGGSGLSVTAENGSTAAKDLGLTTAAAGNVLTGKSVVAGLDTSLLSSLNGGSGLALGTVNFTDRAGQTASVDFSNATSVQDLLDDVNHAPGIHLRASLNSAGSGIQITDQSDGTGSLTVADANGGTTAAKLGIAGTFGNSQTVIQGTNQHKQWVTGSTLLSTLNGGKGIAKTKFSITTATGASTTIDLSGTNVTTVNDLLYQINSKGIAGLTASINANGNGIALDDTTGGGGKLTVTDTNGTAAADLNLAGIATGTKIDGAYEKTLVVSANDTLSTVATAINNLGFGVSASVISDGSATSPYRLSLTANNSGKAGGVVFDAGTTNLGTQNLVAAQDAAVFVGGAGTGQPLLVSSSTNQITNVIKGVTINLASVSAGPVQLSVTADADSLAKSLTGFVSTFNAVTGNISSQSTYDSTTNKAGALLGNSVASQVTDTLYSFVNTAVQSGGQFKTLADIGITVGDKAQLAFDENRFRQAFAQDPTSVQELFAAATAVPGENGAAATTKNTGLAYVIDTALTQLDDPVSGAVTGAIKELTAESTGFTDQITQLNALLTQKKTQLQNEFANLENVLANLQSQQSSLAAIGTVTKTSATTASTSASSSGG